MHRGTRSVGYQQWLPGPPRERQRTYKWANIFSPTPLLRYLYLSALMRWCGSTSEHVATFDRCESVEVRDVDTVMSCLMFPKATVGYYAVRDAGAKAIMATVPETT
jgi:hypothetical protein